VAVPDPSKETHDFAEERKILDDWMPSDPNRPVYTAIRTKFIEKFAEYYVLLREAASAHPHQDLSISVGKLGRLDRESMQLAGLLFNRSNLWVGRDWRKPPILKFLLRALKRTPGGRPPTKLRVAVTAKEMRLSNPKRWTWPKITAALCNCGQDHTIRCQDNLRREVLHLEKMMSKLGISVSV
jgi:hypothetical protein